MSSIKHSKYKNTGVLFELLARQITEDTLNDKESIAASYVRKYFKKGTELNKEYLLYKILTENKTSDINKAERLLNEVIKQRKKLNNSSLKKQKYNLIKDIKESYILEDFFNAKIMNYKLLASIYKIFESELLTESVLNPIEVLGAKETILESLCSTAKPKEEVKDEFSIENYVGDDKELLLLSYKILVEKFNKKYETTLIPEQKMLLREYIYSVSNDNLLTEYVKKQIPIMKKEIEILSKNVDPKEKVINIKIKELSTDLNNILTENKITENHLVKLLKYYELLKELKKLGETKWKRNP